MTTIKLTTSIKANIEICFDLSRSIDLHIESTKATNERAVAGRTSGLIEHGESVTWEATHFCIRQKLSTHIVEMRRPYYFKDVMITGAFRSMEHEHIFESNDNDTLMIDIFQYEIPYGIAGKIFDNLILKKYMIALLVKRNIVIKNQAEGLLAN
ncbi:MAG: SRPBCC family protein [Cyclobacteriaceae bacterium]|nr:SRPBCC family protein [Cyclobacteriaceae bacterium]